MSDNQASAPPQYSPDGRWWWNGQQWVAVPGPASSVIVRNYKDQKEFARDAPRMALAGYHVVAQSVIPNKRGWKNWNAFETNYGSTIVVTYQAG